VISRDVVFDEKQPWDWTNAGTNTEQTAGSFVVHYELSDCRNPTIGDNAVFPATEEEGGESVDQMGVVGHDEATPNDLTPRTAQGQLCIKILHMQHHQVIIQKKHLEDL